MSYINLTTKENKKVVVNTEKIYYLEQLESETIIHFSNKELSVLEKAEEIVNACEAANTLKESEDLGITKKAKEETPEASPFHKFKAE